ncbi:E3 ubiquitin-protein ligase PHF7-like [Haemaphysalis longicornis]
MRAYCVSHRLRQCVVPSDGGHDLCAICAEEMVYPSLSVLVTPCCRHLFHRNCIQQQALSSGSHFFRCGHCNDQESFQKEMQTHGIYIPEQDASWEQEPHAFEELLFRYSRCDAARCFCPQGRKHSEQGSRWHLAICDGCGSGGVHAGCGNLALPATSWLCTNCRCILGREVVVDTDFISGEGSCKEGILLNVPQNLFAHINMSVSVLELCGRGFPSLRLLHGHLRCKHAKEWKGKHRCPHCLFSSRYRYVGMYC